MTLPAGVAYAAEGADLAVTQRGFWSPPYTSCMFAGMGMVLAKVGYTLPLRRRGDAYAGSGVVNFVLAQHRASGRPLSEGSTIHDGMVALASLWRDDEHKPPIKYGVLGKAAVIDLLEQDATVRITGGPLSAFPREWKLSAGYGNSRHAFVLDGTRLGPKTGQRQVHLVDPMLRPVSGYSGQWVGWNRLYNLPIDKDELGRVVCSWGLPSAAIPVPAEPTTPDPLPAAGGMPMLTEYLPGYTAIVDDDAFIRDTPTLRGKVLRETTAAETWTIVGWVKGETTSGSDKWLVRFADGRWEYTHDSNVTAPTPATATELAAARAALAECNTKAVAHATADADLNEAITVWRLTR